MSKTASEFGLKSSKNGFLTETNKYRRHVLIYNY